jgi:hypothetical protein
MYSRQQLERRNSRLQHAKSPKNAIAMRTLCEYSRVVLEYLAAFAKVLGLNVTLDRLVREEEDTVG